MFGIFKKTGEYMDLAKAFDKMYKGLKDLKSQLDNNSFNGDIETTLVQFAQFARREIIERMNKYNWDTSSNVVCLNIRVGKITIAKALDENLFSLYFLARKYKCEPKIKKVLFEQALIY